jgi:protease YdgD
MSEVGRWPAYLVATAVVRIVSSMARNHRFVYDFVLDPIARPRATRIRDAVLGLALALVGAISPASVLKAGEGATADTRMHAPLLPGVGAHDPRGRLDPDGVPWRAVGKLQAASTNFRVLCTGTLVGPSTVLTAAHCVYNPRTQRNFLPGSLHFLIGYDGGLYAEHAVGVKVAIGVGYAPDRPIETIGSDWALVSLDTKLPSADRVLPIISDTPEVGSTVMLGGYQQDHPLVLMADTECRIVGHLVDASGRLLLRHNCAGTRGVSGAPLLIEKGGKWHVAGVDVAAETGVASGLAVILDEARKRF